MTLRLRKAIVSPSASPMLWIILLACCTGGAIAQPLTNANVVFYHGRILSNGAPREGRLDIRIAIYDLESGGSILGKAQTNMAVAITNGLISMPLDFTGVILDGSPRWLQVAVRTNGSAAAFTTLEPRQPLTIVPQALFAKSAASARIADALSSGGANLTAVPSSALFGRIPSSNIGMISTNQMAPSTDELYRAGQRGFVTPFEFGARGDAVHDDTKALQAWINKACNERLIALLPPAPGGFYNISDTLWASNSLTIIGGGGGLHSTSYPYTRSMIRQLAPNKHGLVLLSANDSVHLARIAIVAASPSNWTNDCYGIWFTGGASDADCSIVEQCLVMYFGIGIMAASQADSSFRQCSLGFNGTGIRTAGVANNIAIDSCQVSYNHVRQVHVGAGTKAIIQNTDIAAGAEGTTSAQGVFCDGQDLTMLSCRFEDYTTNACLQISHGSRVTLIGVMFGNFSRATRYSVIVTNSAVVTINCDFGCVGPQGVPILDVGVGRSSVVSIPPVQTYISIGRDGYVATASALTAGRSSWTGSGPGPGGIGRQGWAYPGSLEWEWGAGPFQSDHALYAYAQMPGAGFNGLQAVDLLEFAKEQAVGLRGNGAYLTNLNGANVRPGTITASQIDPATDEAYRRANSITNNHSAPVTLASDATILGKLRLPNGAMVLNTNTAPSEKTAPQAWFEVEASDGTKWKVGLYK